MAKRGGKAASRKSRQRPVRRPTPPVRPSSTPTGAAGEAEAAGSPAATAALTPAPETTADRRPPPSREAGRDRRAAAPDPGAAYGSSILSERARAEYHYVARDLRNIGVLTAVIALLLALAFVLFRVVGLGP